MHAVRYVWYACPFCVHRVLSGLYFFDQHLLVSCLDVVEPLGDCTHILGFGEQLF